MGYDLIIENGLVVDGTGTPGTYDSVGITGNKITAIGDLTTAETARRIDASGHVVSPGFIDTHAMPMEHFLSMASMPRVFVRG
ncbi:MAG: hypothetical protein CM1200mP41_39890 [Gammaproteobacteria bacterium]|nr:MAG: hypothetical protein CM1200mP41_39890 [Gammaproteobacteria bacterium]